MELKREGGRKERRKEGHVDVAICMFNARYVGSHPLHGVNEVRKQSACPQRINYCAEKA